MPETLTVKAPAVTVSSKDVAEVKEKIAHINSRRYLRSYSTWKRECFKRHLSSSKRKVNQH